MKCFPSPHITLLVSLLNVPCTGKVSHAKESQHEKMYLQKHYYIKADHNFCMEETLFKKGTFKTLALRLNFCNTTIQHLYNHSAVFTIIPYSTDFKYPHLLSKNHTSTDPLPSGLPC